MKVAVIGGTGKLGLGLMKRLGQTHHEVAIGSRDVVKARQVVGTGMVLSNVDAAAWCDAAIVTIPYAGHRAMLETLVTQLRGPLVIDSSVPLIKEDFFRIRTESGKSAAEEASALLDGSYVFAAFQTLSHRLLRRPEEGADVLVAGGAERNSDVFQLINDMKFRPIYAGPLKAAGLLESMAALLISINKENNVKDSGIKITGI
jgi:NADPH-dependent F420 reductase